MIYTDGVHMVSDDNLAELHVFAKKIDLKRHFYEGVRKNHPHYDLTNKFVFERAVNAGVILVTPLRSFSSAKKIARLVAKCKK